MKKKIVTLIFLILVSVIFSNNQNSYTRSNLERDYWPTESWQYASYRDVDLNQEIIENMFEHISLSNYQIRSVLLVKDGYLVVEEYSIVGPNTLQPVYSVTKSITSSLIGIAINEGYISGVNQSILDYLWDDNIPNLIGKENITIEHLLTMTSGIAWTENISYNSPENFFRQLIISSNWVEFVLNQDMVTEPGTEWNYNSGGSHLLSAIIEKATGESTLMYADYHIFSKLGFSEYTWETDPQDIYFGGSGLRIMSKDMAKFGYLLLNNGSWNGTQIISEEWVEQATESSVILSDATHYGYQWWIYPQYNVYLALGWAGQIICIIPEYDIVAVFTSELNEEESPFRDLIGNYIIPAAVKGFTDAASFHTVTIISSLLVCSVVHFIMRRKK